MAKVTKREMFAGILDVLAEVGTEDQVAFVEKEIATLDKRASKERKPTKTQIENEGLKADIVGLLAEAGEGRTATEVSKAFEDMTVQKASQLLRQLVAAGLVTRTEGKGKTKTTFAV